MLSMPRVKYLSQPPLLFMVACLLRWPVLHALPHAQPFPAEDMPVALPQEPLPNVPILQPPLPPQSVLPLNVLPINAPIVPTTTSATPAEPEIPEYRRQCFYAEEELCDKPLSNWSPQASEVHSHLGTCHCRPHPTMPASWYCCNVTHMSMISSCSNTTNWTNLHIRNVTLHELDLSNSLYQTLQSLAITDGNITKLRGSFSRFSSIKCLNVSNNNLSEITQRGLIPPNLKVLDISQNNLTGIPNFNQNQNITVDVSGNNNMLCFDIYNSIFRDSLMFVNQENSFCLQNFTFRWFNSTDLISIKELVKWRPLNTDCPSIPGYGNCTCKKEHMVTTVTGDQSEAKTKIISEVDCSNLGLVELPPKLPENTFSLNVSNNKITSIGKHFHTNPTYQSLIYLVADDNKISTMYDLEGTAFMEHFQRLYLRNNALNSIPEYFLSNVLDNHDVGRIIFLGGNELNCDCNSAKTLKYWLLEHNRDIPDYNNIRCRNIPQRVMELREMKLCQSPHDWTDYIYYLIATEVILLIALITKVSYDYWVFKTAGYLPWPASKMPKLPCDWLCES
ncbi:protein halfway [Anastrepha obliqua]|uniref:protein halfway n=1 Tax=Anastrepha obliqua TaxID=95512 RepID=UPI00240939E8|nr:protein halfway [Anastrepha obliqua]XP_054728105.1 protein halfway [Anastrepha obliqua]